MGRLRLAVSTLYNLAQMLHTTTDELLSNESKGTGKRGPASRLQQQVEEISQLPRSKQKLISEMLDGVIGQKQSA